ncbi:MAG: glycosyltransferase family 39 protein [Herpetosiphonaceae bacterium]|nr:glycosyltransferase family 39 protein [Herpetosiphonaceae bacterium]
MISQTRGALQEAPAVATAREVQGTRLTSVLLFVAALLPRAALWQFMTVDEADHWFDRADKFLQAVQNRDWAGTNLVGHPGVTTMWLGAAGIATHHALARLGLLHLADPIAHRILLRLPSAITTSLCVALAFPLLRRLVGGRVALLGTLFWATEPFLVAHAQLLHTDALLTSFIMLAVLAAMIAFRLDEGPDRYERPLRWGMWCTSAIAGGLAVLTKSPSVVLLPMLGLLALAGRWHAPRFRHKLPLLPLVVWGAIAAAVWFILWPATWVDPVGSLASMYREARYDGGSPHGWGNFFLGHAVANPGLLFYPVAILLRLAPWTLLGLIAAVAALVWERRRVWERPALPLLALFILGFVAMMSTGAKKFDRYVLPIFPALDVVAAAGILWLAGTVYRRWATRTARPLPIPATLLWLLLVAGLSANLLAYYPYELAYYDPLLGGGRVAAQTIPIGWGEGYDQVAAFIASQSGQCDRPIAAWYKSVLAPYVCDPVVSMYDALERGKARYAVLYIDQLQRNNAPEVTAALLGKQQPLYTVRLHGIPYASIYELPPAIAHPVPATFGSAIHFNGYDVNATNIRKDGTLTVRLDWSMGRSVAEQYALFVHVLNARGERVGQIDVPLGGSQVPASNWQAGQPVWWDQGIPVAKDLAPGTYWLAVGVYNPQDFKRLPLATTAQSDAPSDGPNALRLGPVALP